VRKLLLRGWCRQRRGWCRRYPRSSCRQRRRSCRHYPRSWCRQRRRSRHHCPQSSCGRRYRRSRDRCSSTHTSKVLHSAARPETQPPTSPFDASRFVPRCGFLSKASSDWPRTPGQRKANFVDGVISRGREMHNTALASHAAGTSSIQKITVSQPKQAADGALRAVRSGRASA